MCQIRCSNNTELSYYNYSFSGYTNTSGILVMLSSSNFIVCYKIWMLLFSSGYMVFPSHCFVPAWCQTNRWAGRSLVYSILDLQHLVVVCTLANSLVIEQQVSWNLFFLCNVWNLPRSLHYVHCPLYPYHFFLTNSVLPHPTSLSKKSFVLFSERPALWNTPYFFAAPPLLLNSWDSVLQGWWGGKKVARCSALQHGERREHRLLVGLWT